tara:strand:- start:100 stop:732 length:633 start_codon:yes stop_codon:yes gene_type:complete
MKRILILSLTLFLGLSCKKNNIDKTTTTEKEAKIEKAFLTLNFGDSPKVITKKLNILLADGNISKIKGFDKDYKYLLDINKYGIQKAMAFIRPHYYENKLYAVELSVNPFNSIVEYENYIKENFDDMLDLMKTKRYRDLYLALNEIYIKKYGEYNRQIESEYKGIFKRYWTINNLNLEFDFTLGIPTILYIDNDIAKLIKSKKIKTKDAI